MVFIERDPLMRWSGFTTPVLGMETLEHSTTPKMTLSTWATLSAHHRHVRIGRYLTLHVQILEEGFKVGCQLSILPLPPLYLDLARKLPAVHVERNVDLRIPSIAGKILYNAGQLDVRRYI